MAEEFAVAGERAKQRLMVAALWRQRFGQCEQRCERREADSDQRPEDRAPACEHQNLSAHNRPSSGAMAITAISVESICAARSPSKRSRTMARASTTPAHAPAACTTRQPIIAQTLPASAQPADPMTKKTSPIATGSRRP